MALNQIYGEHFSAIATIQFFGPSATPLFARYLKR